MLHDTFLSYLHDFRVDAQPSLPLNPISQWIPPPGRIKSHCGWPSPPEPEMLKIRSFYAHLDFHRPLSLVISQIPCGNESRLINYSFNSNLIYTFIIKLNTFSTISVANISSLFFPVLFQLNVIQNDHKAFSFFSFLFSRKYVLLYSNHEYIIRVLAKQYLFGIVVRKFREDMYILTIHSGTPKKRSIRNCNNFSFSLFSLSIYSIFFFFFRLTDFILENNYSLPFIIYIFVFTFSH